MGLESVKNTADENSHNFTTEQKKIIKYTPLPGQILKVMAFAGTGKTTTLIEYAKARPDKSFLYVAFNKSVQLEAVKKFGTNVSCRTAHSLAFAKTGWKYKQYLATKIRPYQIVKFLELDSNDYNLAAFVMTTFNNYLASSSRNVSNEHIPLEFYDIHENKADSLIDLVERLINGIHDGNYQKIGVTHDWYLKEYQLSNPHLKYDYIFLDEAQDINSVIADIILKQIQCKNPPAVIMVGDNHQQIYSFRGAKGILAKTEASKTMFLTQSFRFNNNIGKIASMLLECFKSEKKKVKGIQHKKKPTWDKNKYTVICRTNAILFDHAVKLLINKKKIGFVGPIEGYRFSLMNDISNLVYCKNYIKDNFIKNFKGYKELKDYASKANDVEITSMCTVVEKYGDNLPDLVKMIFDEHLPCDECHVTLTTAHKAKGLEWNNVLISNDFIPLVKNNEVLFLEKKYHDEINLLYVAITRAIHNLKLSSKSSLIDFITTYSRAGTH